MGESDGVSIHGFPVCLDSLPITIEELDGMINEEIELYEAHGIPAALAVSYIDAWRIMPDSFGDPLRIGEVYSDSEDTIFVRTTYPLVLEVKGYPPEVVRDAMRQVVGHETGHVVLGVLYGKWEEGDLWRASDAYGTTY